MSFCPARRIATITSNRALVVGASVLLLTSNPGIGEETNVGPMHQATGAEVLIPVATTDRNYTLKQQEYEQFTRDMGHLPTMSREYIFGQKIAQPKTDQFGHIHLSDVDQPYPVTASGGVENGDPPRPAARSKKKALTETQPKRAAVRKRQPLPEASGTEKG